MQARNLAEERGETENRPRKGNHVWELVGQWQPGTLALEPHPAPQEKGGERANTWELLAHLTFDSRNTLGEGGGVALPCSLRCQLYSKAVSIPPSSQCLSLFLWLERKGMGGAPLHSTSNHKPAPGLGYRMYPDSKPHPCGLGRPRGLDWGTVTLHCLSDLPSNRLGIP